MALNNFSMKRSLSVLFFAIIFSFAANAQPYQTAVGARLAYFSGISIKHFVAEKAAIECIMGMRWGGGVLVGLIEFEPEIPGASGLYFIFGGGVHLGYYQKIKYYDGHGVSYRSNERVFSPGIDATIGAEYKFGKLPLSLSFDFRPFLDFVDGTPPSYVDGGFTLRYTFE